MYGGVGTLLLGSFAPPAAKLCGVTCDWSLELLERMITWGRDLPASHFWLASPPGWWIALFYSALGLAAAIPAVRSSRRTLIAISAVWIFGAILFSGIGRYALPRMRERSLACHFVAVGHGVSVLVELPDGHNLLYDAGRLGSPLTGVRPVASV